jgi:hypothetical protein
MKGDMRSSIEILLASDDNGRIIIAKIMFVVMKMAAVTMLSKYKHKVLKRSSPIYKPWNLRNPCHVQQRHAAYSS